MKTINRENFNRFDSMPGLAAPTTLSILVSLETVSGVFQQTWQIFFFFLLQSNFAVQVNVATRPEQPMQIDETCAAA